MTDFYNKTNFQNLCIALSKQLNRQFQIQLTDQMSREVKECMQFLNGRYPNNGEPDYLDAMMSRAFGLCMERFTRQQSAAAAAAAAVVQHVPAVPDVPPRPQIVAARDVAASSDELNDRLNQMTQQRERDIPAPAKPQPQQQQQEHQQQDDVDDFSDQIMQQLIQQRQASYQQRPVQQQQRAPQVISVEEKIVRSTVAPVQQQQVPVQQQVHVQQQQQVHVQQQQVPVQQQQQQQQMPVQQVPMPVPVQQQQPFTFNSSTRKLSQSHNSFIMDKIRPTVYYQASTLPSQMTIECIITPYYEELMRERTITIGGIHFVPEVQQPFIIFHPINMTQIPYQPINIHLPNSNTQDQLYIHHIECGAPSEKYAGLLHRTRLFINPFHINYKSILTNKNVNIVQGDSILLFNTVQPGTITWFNSTVELHIIDPTHIQLKHRGTIISRLDFLADYLQIGQTSYKIQNISSNNIIVLEQPFNSSMNEQIGWIHSSNYTSTQWQVTDKHDGTITPTPEIVERWGDKLLGDIPLATIAQHINWQDHDDIVFDMDWIEIDMPFELIAEDWTENQYYLLQKKLQTIVLGTYYA